MKWRKARNIGSGGFEKAVVEGEGIKRLGQLRAVTLVSPAVGIDDGAAVVELRERIWQGGERSTADRIICDEPYDVGVIERLQVANIIARIGILIPGEAVRVPDIDAAEMKEVQRLVVDGVRVANALHLAMGQIPIRYVVARMAQDRGRPDETRRKVAIALVDEHTAVDVNMAVGLQLLSPPGNETARRGLVGKCSKTKVVNADAQDRERVGILCRIRAGR